MILEECYPRIFHNLKNFFDNNTPRVNNNSKNIPMFLNQSRDCNPIIQGMHSSDDAQSICGCGDGEVIGPNIKV